LLELTEARVKYDWSHTASEMALLANCHRDPNGPAFSPRDFDPTSQPRKPASVPITVLKNIFVKD
jgi:hypothetical protein